MTRPRLLALALTIDLIALIALPYTLAALQWELTHLPTGSEAHQWGAHLGDAIGSALRALGAVK
jgi:hypothetical protein